LVNFAFQVDEENISLMVNNMLEASAEEKRQEKVISGSLDLDDFNLNTPEMENDYNCSREQKRLEVFPSKPALSASCETYCVESPRKADDEEIEDDKQPHSTSGGTYYVGSPKRVTPEPSEQSQNASLMIRQYMEEQEKEKLSTSRETYTLEDEAQATKDQGRN
jgi:DsbC/DsbD-like thiol-disulfide interchange protein